MRCEHIFGQCEREAMLVAPRNTDLSQSKETTALEAGVPSFKRYFSKWHFDNVGREGQLTTDLMTIKGMFLFFSSYSFLAIFHYWSAFHPSIQTRHARDPSSSTPLIFLMCIRKPKHRDALSCEELGLHARFLALNVQWQIKQVKDRDGFFLLVCEWVGEQKQNESENGTDKDMYERRKGKQKIHKCFAINKM